MDEKHLNQLNILKYWRSFESFEMPSINVRKSVLGIEGVPVIIKGPGKVPWPLLKHQVDDPKKVSNYVFNVYIGLIKQEVIQNKIQKILQVNSKDYDLRTRNTLTCLAGFTLDAQGYLCADSYINPDYIVSLRALEQYNMETNWEAGFNKAKDKFDTLKTAFQTAMVEPITYQNIKVHIQEILQEFSCLKSDDIDYPAVIHKKKLKAPRKQKEVVVNQYIADPNKDEQSSFIMDDAEKPTDLDILPSFFLDDITRVINSVPKNKPGLALTEYLNDAPATAKQDVNQNQTLLRKLTHPQKLPLSCWPEANRYTLSMAQQVAVNVATEKSEGLFSVNGPPGTGKTTLLRDIIADVYVQRAEQLAKLNHPTQAFLETTQSDIGFKLNSTTLRSDLFNYEMVVATSNNNAAANISKELPVSAAVDKHRMKLNPENEYFSEIANHCFNSSKSTLNDNKPESYWGIFSAALGNKKNNNLFFESFWNINNSNSLRYLLKYWDLGQEEFEIFFKKNKYNTKEEWRWLQEKFKIIDKEYNEKWQKECKHFKKLKADFEKIQREYTDIAEALVKLEAINVKLVNMQDNLEKNELSFKQLNSEYEQCHKQKIELEQLLKNNTEYYEALKQLDVAKRKLATLIAENKKAGELIPKYQQEIKVLEQQCELYKSTLKSLKEDKYRTIQLQPHWLLQLLFPRSIYISQWRKQLKEIEEKISFHSNADYQTEKELILLRKDLNKQQSKYNHAKHNYEHDELEVKHAEEKVIKLLGDHYHEINLPKLLKDHHSLLESKNQELEVVNSKHAQLNTEIKAKRHSLLISRNEIDKLSNKKHALKIKIDTLREKDFCNDIENFPREEFWQQPYADLQQTSPWLNHRIQTIRTELFWSSVRLHKYFVVLARTPLMSNITALLYLLKDKLPQEHEPNIRSLWSSFFLTVPVVSTTFASVQRLFRHLGQEHIGWLMIDEAGQTPPHYAVGAIWRSKRAVVVGDPLQIEPVVTLPRLLSQKLYEYHQVSALYDATSQSAQTIADLSNPIGTYIKTDGEPTWIGTPLIVHRRCNDPMFSVANQIAYNGLMVQATHSSDSMIDQVFQESLWISVNGRAKNSESHWIKQEGMFACTILNEFITKLKTIPSIFIITPFNDIKKELMDMIYFDYFEHWLRVLNLSSQSKILDNKLTSMIGTVHTFQGKQADAVILLLGGNPAKPAAISWVSSKPNMLNVAITRAKKLLYVIGNRKIWANQPYFSNLACQLKYIVNESQLESSDSNQVVLHDAKHHEYTSLTSRCEVV